MQSESGHIFGLEESELGEISRLLTYLNYLCKLFWFSYREEKNGNTIEDILLLQEFGCQVAWGLFSVLGG